MMQSTMAKQKAFLVAQADVLQSYFEAKSIGYELVTLDYDGSHAAIRFLVTTQQSTSEVVADLFEKWPNVVKVDWESAGQAKVFTVVFDMDRHQHV